jgi:hypothetical protein
MNFLDIIRKVEKYMEIITEKSFVIDLIIAVALSLALPRPVWLMVTSPPSSGKTEMLRLISSLDDYHSLTNISNRFLFSGHPDAEGGYMIRQVKEKGILAFPDFTTILSLNANQRAEILNQLRVIYDGRAGRGTGIDTGPVNEWVGKVGLIACVTQVIEIIKSIGNDLGERCLYYNYLPNFPCQPMVSRTAEQENIRNEIPDMVKDFISEKIKLVNGITVSDDLNETIFKLVSFIAKGRAAVNRDSYTREITNVYDPEQPYRLNESLTSLYKSLAVIHPDDGDRIKKILQQVSYSSIPYMRLKILELLATNDTQLKIDSFKDVLRVSDTVIRRHVEDMEAQKLVKKVNLHGSTTNQIVLHEEFGDLVKLVISA